MTDIVQRIEAAAEAALLAHDERWASHGCCIDIAASVAAGVVADEIERLRTENARLRQHVILWRGSCCPCDENPCPLADAEDGACG